MKSNIKSKYKIWFYPNNDQFQPVSNDEIFWANKLNKMRKKEYLFSRGLLRKSLSNLFSIDSLDVPIYSPPGKAPKIMDGFGYITLSHCKTGTVIGWAEEKIGIDIESKNRSFDYELVAKRFFFKNEIDILLKNPKEISKHKALSMWVIKEAAIKWQEGKIYNDLANWGTNNNFIQNSISKIKLNSYLINYESWIIGIVIKNNLNTINPIVKI